MPVNSFPRSKGRLTFTILSISLLTVMAGAAIAPALGVIREHFASDNGLLVQLIVSIPALFIILTNLFFARLCKLLKTRTLALVGLVMYVVFGAGAFFAQDIWTVLVMRALLGVSVGMIMPLSTGLLAYYFPPEEQAHLMGLAAFMNQMGGVTATLLSGLLANISWNLSFLVYLLGVAAVVLVAAFLPNERLVTTVSQGRKTAPECGGSAEGREAGSGESAKDREAAPYYGGSAEGREAGKPGASLLRFAPSVVGMYLQMLLFFIFPTNFAITARANAALTGNDITLIMVGLDVVAALIGLVFGWMMGHMGRCVKYLAPLTFILGYGCYALGVSTPLLLAGSVLVGIANGIGMPYLNTIASIKGGKDAATTVMPMISAALYLGQFTSPLLVSPLAGIVGSATADFAVGGAIGGDFANATCAVGSAIGSGFATAPYIVGVIFGAIYLLQTFCSRKYLASA